MHIYPYDDIMSAVLRIAESFNFGLYLLQPKYK